jgi:DNA end-binding protein Ku
VESLAGDFDPAVYHDDYREQLLALIDAKVHGGEGIVAPEAPSSSGGEVVDLLTALRESLARAGGGQSGTPGTTKRASAAKPAAKRPATKQTAAKPAAKKAAATKPAATKPAAKKAAATKPASKKTAAKPAAKKPAAGKAPVARTTAKASAKTTAKTTAKRSRKTA